jgi:hypothetical protein
MYMFLDSWNYMYDIHLLFIHSHTDRVVIAGVPSIELLNGFVWNIIMKNFMKNFRTNFLLIKIVHN